jgi:GAF domain-containing protein
LRNGDQLILRVAQNDTLQARSGPGTARDVLGNIRFEVSMESVAGYVAATGKSQNIPDVRELGAAHPFHHNPEWDRRNQYETRSLLTVPLTDPEGHVQGVMQLMNRVGRDGAVGEFYADDLTLVSSMAAQAALALRYHGLKRAGGSVAPVVDVARETGN